MPLSEEIIPEMTETAQEVVSEQNQKAPQPKEKTRKKLWSDFRTRVDTCKQYRRKLVATWTSNIDYRRGKPFQSQTDEDRVAVNLDWSLTKAKQATLFSQIPQVRVDHGPQSQAAGPWLHAFEQKLNDTIVQAGIETAMDECLPDCINASGIGAILCSHEVITEDKEVPAIDMSVLPQEHQTIFKQTGALPGGQAVPMITVPSPVDSRYVIQRLSPADLLWPINFTGSDFDQAPWIGRSGRVSWAQALNFFGKSQDRPSGLVEEDYDSVIGEDRTTLDKLTHDIEKDKIVADEAVGFDEVFYREFHFDTEAKSFFTIHRLVYIAGKDEPVIDEPWKGQKVAQDGSITGAFRFPIRVLTLAYVTDETIPPSDSAIARPQINEMNKSRTQMILQRERSLPLRWANVNGIDPTVLQSLMRGTWQGIIPVQGDGSRYIGEVARANMPQENFAFDKIVRGDLNDIWSIGPNQEGSGSGVETAEEAKVLQGNFQARVGRERAKVSKFFVSVAEVIGGLLCLYEQPEAFGQGFDPSISKALNYSILADSTVLIDSNQRIQRLVQFLNFTAKSGYVNIEPVLKEIATLSGLDPNVVIQQPQPKPPVEPNISLRLTGVEDLLNPMALGFLMKSGQAPPADLIEQAKQLISLSVTPPLNAPPTYPGMNPAPPDGGAGPAGPPGPDGSPMMPPMPPPHPMMQPNAGPLHGIVPPQPHGPMPPPPVAPPGKAHPQWTAIDKINKRTEEGQG